MAQIWIPSLLRELTNGADCVTVEGQTIGECLSNLDKEYPGIRDRLCQGNNLVSTLRVAVDGKISQRGIRTRVMRDSAVHFIPAIAGG
jgi:molybdopterin synthase sulfur carrier subunit